MEWKWLLLGVALGMILLPTFLLLGFRLLMWLLMRRLRKAVLHMQETMDQGGQPGPGMPGVQVWSWGMGAPALSGPVQLMEPDESVRPNETEAPAEPVELAELQRRFLEKTGLSPEEWDQVRDQLIFVHDGLSDGDLSELGFSDLPEEGSPRQRVRGRGQLLGSLNEPVEADVYRL